ncbi:MAG TPA: hypothetical protein VGN64_15505, partial [Dyadobacter sp.]|nr:hypothetical protein [Dyadobacter sp.]
SLVLGTINLLIVYIFRTSIAGWQFADDESGKTMFLQMFVFLPLILMSMTFPIFLQGQGRYRSYTISQLLPLVFQTGILALSLVSKLSFQTVLLAQIAYWCVMAATGIINSVTMKYHPIIDPALFTVFSKLAVNMFPLILLQYGLARFAVLAGSHYLAPADLGHFIVASNLAEALSIVYTSLSPIIFSQSLQQRSDINPLFQTIRFSNMAMVLILLIMLSAGKPIFLYIFGNSYEQSWPLLMLTFPGVVMHGISVLLINYLIASEMTSRVLFVYLTGLFVLISSSTILCPAYGGPGLCSALALSSLTTLVTSSLLIKRKSNYCIYSLFIPKQEDWLIIKKLAVKKREL